MTPGGAVPLAVRARDVLTSEWTKFRSVRSSYWCLLVAVVTPLGFSLLVAFTIASQDNLAEFVDEYTGAEGGFTPEELAAARADLYGGESTAT
jgi:hypothetical protein